MGSRKPQIAMFPSWGMGHFLPFVEFAKRMSIHHGFAVLIITPPAVKADIRSLASSVPDIRFVDLSAPHLDSLPMTDLPTKFAAMEEYKGPLKDVLGSLKDEISAFVIDFFCAALIESSAALHNPTYVLSTDSASNLCLKFFYDTLDSQTTESLKDMDGPIYPIGPLIRSPDAVHGKSECLNWLDRQPDSSVMYVSFGSMNWFLSPDQTRELALGLEASGHRFLWLLKGDNDVSALLPPGFEMRTRDRGIVWTSWAPQIPILSHPATAGFVSHCGWNSTLESVTNGVPIVPWPVRAEQKTNAFFLVNEIGLGIEPEWGPNWWVGKDEVEKAVKELMEGEKGRKVSMRAAELKESARKALAAGGSSMDILAVVTAQWKKKAS
ncbi:anthocyanidin 5,3-O-glucosyltransferase-like [Cryptomeria japonica]|uniref:anthocyanidin 5,3-O-glucosyltransferase-like n=1 Tax=Cryptomeria japonica TaxID=3369 RepID=UPI0027DA1D8F|nr:anthocyanidin 5,3-O-glucosyltransferase-like [Cryptomeria japonica]